MLINLKKYYRPRSVEAAIRLLSANPGRCRVLAGGAHLLTRSDRDIEEVVDISALKLRAMKQEESVIRLGATVTLQLMMDNPRLRKFAGGILIQACRRTSVSRMIRNQHTLGGEICVPQNHSDLAVVLLALDARVKFINFSMEEKEMSVSEFWSMLAKPRSRKDPAFVLPGLLLEILIPRRKQSAAAFEAIAQIASQPSLISAGAVIDFAEDHTCATARVALGAFADKAIRLAHIESQLQGKPLTRELIDFASSRGWDELQPISDARASSGYRRTVAPRLVRRVLSQCLKGK